MMVDDTFISQEKGETPMEHTAATPRRGKKAQTETATSCTHGRLVEEVRSADGAETGRLICKECQAEFQDSSDETSNS